MHRDIKPQTLMIGEHFRLKIGDFNIAKIYEINLKSTKELQFIWAGGSVELRL